MYISFSMQYRSNCYNGLQTFESRSAKSTSPTAFVALVDCQCGALHTCHPCCQGAHTQCPFDALWHGRSCMFVQRIFNFPLDPMTRFRQQYVEWRFGFLGCCCLFRDQCRGVIPYHFSYQANQSRVQQPPKRRGAVRQACNSEVLLSFDIVFANHDRL